MQFPLKRILAYARKSGGLLHYLSKQNSSTYNNMSFSLNQNGHKLGNECINPR